MSLDGMHESARLTYSSEDSIAARKEIFRLLGTYDATPEETERSLGLFLRGSLLARFLAVAGVYQRIVGIPGDILDVGTWRGQTAVLCENLRAIYEPLNFTRRVVAFDTFDGYAGFKGGESHSDAHADGTYAVGGAPYASWLRRLLTLHESSNAMGHVTGKHTVIEGDARITIPTHFANHAGALVALAFLDLNSLEATRSALESIWPRVAPGGAVAFWQLTRRELQGEAQAYLEVIVGSGGHRLESVPTYPGLCIAIKS